LAAKSRDWEAFVPMEYGIENYIDVEGKNYYKEVLKRRGENEEVSDMMTERKLKS
jgi:oligo-1,6-glucosidase